MQRSSIEEIVVNEFRDLCGTCLHSDDCTYFKHKKDKIIIQCELFESIEGVALNENVPAGLCKSCDRVADCHLPGRKEGTWRCNEFQ